MGKVTRREWYRRVNAAWPENVPKLTAEEAVRAAKRLYRFERGYTWRGPVKVTSGRRSSAIRGGVIIVNPIGGWHELVHLLSHYLSPGKHGADHARCELRLIKEVIRRGWLDGKLRSEPKPAAPAPTPDDVRAEKKARIEERIARWESKKRRAETALKKLRKSLRYYEKQALVQGV
jgi:hypothetical protein